MEILTAADIKQMIEEIQGDSEKSRRAKALRRQEMYMDGGRRFLLEQIQREFDKDAIPEMRLAPLNLLKKMVNKRAVVYKTPPVRKALKPSDQAIIDYYTETLSLNQAMQKANRYLCLHSNTSLYVRPWQGDLKLNIVPPFLYSIKPNKLDRTLVDAWVFSAFNDGGEIAAEKDVPSATGSQGFSRNPGVKTSKDQIDSQEIDSEDTQTFMVWSDLQHATVNGKGEILNLSPEKGDEQYINPISVSPVINLARDRDNEPWATQFEDAIDLTIAIMLGWTDLLTIAKHQGFSILTVVSQEEPKQLKIGVNKAIWLKANEGQIPPSISYVQGSSPLAEYKEILLDLVALLLSTNDMPPNSIGGSANNQSFTSGFHALIEMSDVIEAVEQDKPLLRKAEQDLWKVIAKWHNWMLDVGVLSDKAAALGKASEEFEVSIAYRDIKPVESEQERIQAVKDLRALGLITRKDSMKKLHPDLTEDLIDSKLKEIETENQEQMGRVQTMLQDVNNSSEGMDEENGEESSEEETS